MSDRPSDGEPSEEERRQRRAAVFGDVLPDATSDEQAEGWSEPSDGGRSRGADPSGGASEGPTEGPSEGTSEEWLRREVPPHHL